VERNKVAQESATQTTKREKKGVEEQEREEQVIAVAYL
jgi:hypothetical protein